MSVLILVVASALSSAAPGAARYEFDHAAMGTRFRIVLHAPRDVAADAAADAFARVDEIDHRLSDYRVDSDLRRLELEAVGRPVPVHPDVWEVLDASQRLAAATGGAFDVTVGSLTRLWRWAARRGIDPDPERVAAARARTGYRQLVLDPETRSVTLANPGVQLDAGGIAKGYAVDAAFELLADRGLAIALVDGGGDIRVGAPPPASAGWSIAVPDGPDGAVRSVDVANMAIATSGSSYRQRRVGEETFSHLVDPRSGLGVTAGRVVTVFAATTTLADALASALGVLGSPGSETARALGATDAWVFETGIEDTGGDHGS